MPAEPSAKGTRRSVRIGPYAVQAPLTLGSLGSAYRATDADGRTVVLKVLPSELTGNATARDRVQREAKRAVKVRSPHVTRVLDFGEAGGTWYLVLEPVEGDTLAQFVQRRGTLEGAVARDVIVQVARVLAVLQRDGLVPRDLSAENFRVVRGPDPKGRITVKLVDLGLLRPQGDDGPGDVRAALTGLGATAALMLTGRATAKLDLATLGGDVSDELRGVLRRLLATRSEERYQTPAAVLDALGEEEEAEGRLLEEDDDPAAAAAAAAFVAAEDDPLAAFTETEQEAEPTPKPAVVRKKAVRRRGEDPEDDGPTPPPPPARGRRGDDSPAPRRSAGNRKALLWGGIAFAAMLLIGGGVVVVLMNMDSEPKEEQQANSDSHKKKAGPPPVTTAPGNGKAKPADTAKQGAGDKPKEPDKPAPPPKLYEPKLDQTWNKVKQTYLGPWAAGPQAPPDTPVVQVSRVPPPDAKPGTAFDSIAAACAAIPEGKWGIVEIWDNGPLFEGPISVSGRNVVLRGAQGYTPLVVWDPALTRAELKAGKPAAAPTKEKKEEVPALLTVEKGTLLLSNVSLAVDWPEKVGGSGCFVRVAGGDFSTWQSTFTVAGKPHGTFTAVRFESGGGKRCGLSLCYARGARLTALDVTAPGPDVMIDRSLLVGGEPPVVAVSAGKAADATTLRVIRSTLAGRETALQVRPTPDAAGEPALNWLSYDALLWRAGDGAGGTVADLPRDAAAKAMTWRAVNTLYAGWQTLLSGREPLSGSDLDGWHAFWKVTEGDVSRPQEWGKALPADPAEVLQWVYNTYPGPLAFQAWISSGVLGCDLWQLPWVRGRWLDLTTQRTRPGDARVLAPDEISPVPQPKDQLFHGARLDLDRDKIDLGAYLRRQKLAPIVVLHLHGTGRHKTSPVVVKGSSLFVYFEPPAAGAEPLVLEPDPNVPPPPDANALFDLTGGSLWMIGGDVRFPDFKTALLPHYVVGVRGGHLALTTTRLQGPLTSPPAEYWGLVRVEGTGSSSRKPWVPLVTANRSVLLSARIVLHLAVAGIRADLRDSLLVGTDRGVYFEPGPPQKIIPTMPTPAGAQLLGLYGETRLNLELTADHCTFAARDADFYVEDVPVKRDAQPYFWPAIAEPIVVQTKDCAFLNPFADKDGKAAPAAVLGYGGIALPRGLLCWQGEGDVYDKRLHAFVEPSGKDGKPLRPEKAQGYGAWERLWGPGDAKAVLDWQLNKTLDLEKSPDKLLDALTLPAHAGVKEKPGADVQRLLGPPKKPKKP